MPTPGHSAKADQLHAESKKLFEHYVSAIEHDMNNHAKTTGKAMDMAYAHNDVARILRRDIPPGMLAALAAAAILKEIERKGRGGRSKA